MKHKQISIKEPWQIGPRYVYLNVTMEEALAMHRDDVKSDPHNPSTKRSEVRAEGDLSEATKCVKEF